MTPNDNQVALPELPEWNGEFMTESEFAEAAQAYALEAVQMNQAAGGEAVAWARGVRNNWLATFADAVDIDNKVAGKPDRKNVARELEQALRKDLAAIGGE